jgi:hypothetical protein
VLAEPGPEWSVADVAAGWGEALHQLGEHVHRFNLGDRLSFYDHAYVDIETPGVTPAEGHKQFRKALGFEAVQELAVNGLAAMLWKVRPRVLLVITGFLIPGEMLDQARRHGTYVIVLHTEEPYEVERELDYAKHADLNLINDPTHIEKFNAVAPTLYVPHAYRPGFHVPNPSLARTGHDLAFVGTGFGSRRQFFTDMARAGAFKDRDVQLYGNWQGTADDSILRPHLGVNLTDCLDNADTVAVYQAAKCGINLYRRERDADHEGYVGGWSMGPREVEMAACGLFFLRDPRPEGDDVLSMLPAFSGPAEAAEEFDWWMRHESNMKTTAHQAREAIADRTFGNHARSLLLRLLQRKV